jgi:hypothetical protein
VSGVFEIAGENPQFRLSGFRLREFQPEAHGLTSIYEAAV